VLKGLLDRGLVRTAGRSHDPGRPLLYRTTQAFLELFSLPDLSSLPTLEERAELVRGQAPVAEE
jgi:segregation and condensation protein B